MSRVFLAIVVLALSRATLTACAVSMASGGVCAAPDAPGVEGGASGAEFEGCCSGMGGGEGERPDGPRGPGRDGGTPSCCEMQWVDPAKLEIIETGRFAALRLGASGVAWVAWRETFTGVSARLDCAVWPPGRRRAVLGVWTI